jgi:hypothetical protein
VIVLAVLPVEGAQREKNVQVGLLLPLKRGQRVRAAPEMGVGRCVGARARMCGGGGRGIVKSGGIDVRLATLVGRLTLGGVVRREGALQRVWAKHALAIVGARGHVKAGAEMTGAGGGTGGQTLDAEALKLGGHVAER